MQEDLRFQILKEVLNLNENHLIFGITPLGYPKYNELKISVMFLEKFFEDSVLLFPNAIAIEQGEIKYTYIEIEHTANKIANFLKAKGIGPEGRPGCRLHPGVGRGQGPENR